MVEYKYTIEKSPQITLRGVRGRRKSLRSSHLCTLNYLLLFIKKIYIYYECINAF